MHPEWPLILFTFFNCLAGGIFLMQGILTLSGKGKAMQLASCISAIVALAIGGLSVFFHLQHPLRMLNGFGHITSGITIELIFVIVFAIVVVSYFLMMRRSEEGVAPKWCAVLAIVVSLALPFATGDSYLMSAIPVWDTMLLPLYYVVATVMLGGLAAILAQVLKEETGAKVRGIELNLLQRCGAHLASETDIEESFMAGKAAVENAVNGINGRMIGFERGVRDGRYACKTKLIPLMEVANVEKKIPREWINAEGNGVNHQFIEYALPLIQGEPDLPKVDSLPRFAKLKKILAK